MGRCLAYLLPLAWSFAIHVVVKNGTSCALLSCPRAAPFDSFGRVIPQVFGIERRLGGPGLSLLVSVVAHKALPYERKASVIVVQRHNGLVRAMYHSQLACRGRCTGHVITANSGWKTPGQYHERVAVLLEDPVGAIDLLVQLFTVLGMRVHVDLVFDS